MNTKRLEKIYKIKKHPDNPRVIKDVKYHLLVKSIKEFPEMLEKRPLVVNKDLIVLGGNMRLRAAEEAGLKEIWIDQTDWDEAKQKEFIIKDNSGFGEWDWDALANNWDVDDLNDWGLDLPHMFDEPEPEATEDDYTEPDNMQVDVVLGDLIEIGEHRLLCGDSTDSNQVAKLMNGKKWHLSATSPPYNRGNSCGNLLNTKGIGVGKKDVNLYNNKNDDNRNPIEYFNFCISILKVAFLFRNEDDHSICWNVAYNAKSRDNYGKIVFANENPYQVKETIIWDKTHSINLPQVGIYSRRCELVFVMSSNDTYRTSQKYNDCRWNYWQIKSAGSQITGQQVEHRATFPVDVANNMINQFSFINDIVFDMFLGSGTTMVAAHQLKRKCYGMELDPKYCQVIIDRMQKLDSDLQIKINGKIYEKTEYVL
tara:strand:+ start:1353 stop:2627 length:1275 start_codon:yes stop_codon:yes gene_type:complete